MVRASATKTAAAKKAAASPQKEDTVTTTDTAAPAETAAPANPGNEAAPAATEAPKAEATIDTSAFDAALATAMTEMDQSTGTLAPAQLEPVVKAYQALDGSKAKAKVRASIEQGVKDALELENGNVPKARALNVIRTEITKSRGGGGTPSTPKDPTEAFIEAVVALQLAYSHLTQNPPEGVGENWQAKANEVAQNTMEDVAKLAKYSGEGEAPEVSNLAKRAWKLATGKGKGGGSSSPRAPFTGERHDVAKHIVSAFAEKASGDFLTVAQIVSYSSTEYGDDHPSPGAVTARLFPKSGKCTVEGVEAIEATANSPKGARKAAAAA
jgi:hypothetical protein